MATKKKQVTVTGVISTAVARKGETVTVDNTERVQSLIEAGYLSSAPEPAAEEDE